jgi:hypothetical protein
MAALAAAACMLAGSAAADVYRVDFTVDPQSVPLAFLPHEWTLPFGGVAPYGLNDQSVIHGSFTYDTAFIVDPDSSPHLDNTTGGILSLDYATGTKTWALSDLHFPTLLQWSVGDLVNLNSWTFYFDNRPANGVNNSSALVGDDDNIYSCGSCTTWTQTFVRATSPAAVPEPASWALMILGFGAAGSALRLRSRRTARA